MSIDMSARRKRSNCRKHSNMSIDTVCQPKGNVANAGHKAKRRQPRYDVASVSNDNAAKLIQKALIQLEQHQVLSSQQTLPLSNHDDGNQSVRPPRNKLAPPIALLESLRWPNDNEASPETKEARQVISVLTKTGGGRKRQ